MIAMLNNTTAHEYLFISFTSELFTEGINLIIIRFNQS